MSSSLPDIGRVTTSQIGGLEIRLARGGRSDGIPMLLTSPWPESIYCFRGILPAIKELGPVILVDLPGFGRSESRPDVMSPEAMGDFVIKLAEHLGSTISPDRDLGAIIGAINGDFVGTHASAAWTRRALLISTPKGENNARPHDSDRQRCRTFIGLL